jgi:hypothetical protein
MYGSRREAPKQNHERANQMSLDVSLQGPPVKVDCYCSCGEHKHEREEPAEYYTANLTHNLTEMAAEAGIYEILWRPEEVGITKASELIEPLRTGLATLLADPDRFKKFDPANRWGDYECLVKFVRGYLANCEETPNAEVVVWR